MTLSRMRLLLLAQGPNVFGVPSANVLRLARASEEQVLSGMLDDVAGASPTKLNSLAQLLKMRMEKSSAAASREAFVLRDGEREAGFLVEALLREDEAVVKSLGPRLKSADAYLGGTLLPDGRVALVLNPDYLINAAMRDTSAVPEAAAPRAQARPARKRRILFVEDSDTLRALGKRILERAGFDVQAAADGRQGLELWKRTGADVVVTDLEMPVMDGLALTRAIRAAGGRNVRIVLLSANDTSQSRAAASDAGVSSYLVKSSSLKSKLIDVINANP